MNKSYHTTLCTDAVVNGLTLIKNRWHAVGILSFVAACAPNSFEIDDQNY